MKDKRPSKKAGGPGAKAVYAAPRAVVWFFYSLLAAWTAVSVGFIWASGEKGVGGDLLWLTMIAFVLGFTWYFSLGISYRLEMGEEGDLELTSFRRVLHLKPRDISQVEPPFLPWGFLRFKLEREKAYLFCSVTHRELQAIVKRLVEMNPDMRIRMR